MPEKRLSCAEIVSAEHCKQPFGLFSKCMALIRNGFAVVASAAADKYNKDIGMKLLEFKLLKSKRLRFAAAFSVTVMTLSMSFAFADASFAQDGSQQVPQFGQQPGFNLPDPVKRMLVGPAAQPGQAPVVVPPISFVDVNSGRFGKLEIDLEDAQFLDGAAKHLHLTARDMDLTEGLLKSLDVNVEGGNIQDFIFDKLTLTTQGSMRFDTGVLFNQKILQFVEPTQAEVTAEISQESLNKFINAPSTLDRLSASVAKKSDAIASFLAGAKIGLTVSNGQLVLAKGNRVNLKFDAKVGVGDMAVPIPVEVQSQLELKDGWVHVVDSKLLTSGHEISPAVSQWLVKNINGLSNWGVLSDDIKFRFTDLKVKPGKGFLLKGTAQVNRLRFGRQ